MFMPVRLLPVLFPVLQAIFPAVVLSALCGIPACYFCQHSKIIITYEMPLGNLFNDAVIRNLEWDFSVFFPFF